MLKELENHGLQEIGQWIKSDRYSTVPVLRYKVDTGINFDFELSTLIKVPQHHIFNKIKTNLKLKEKH